MSALEDDFWAKKERWNPHLILFIWDFAINVNFVSVQFIHNKVVLKAINHPKMLVLFYMNAHVPFLKHSLIEIEMNWNRHAP